MNAARCVADRAATIGSGRQDDAERQHRLQALAGRQSRPLRCAEPDAVTRADGPSDRRGVASGALPEPSRASHVRSTPVMAPSRSVTAASERRPGLARRALVCAVEAAWDGSAAPADRAHPRCPGCAGRWPQACRGSAWPRRTAAAPPRATRSGPAVVLARSAWCSRCGRLRNRRASSSTSRKVWSRQVRAIRSSRSPCSPMREVDLMCNCT